MYKWLYLVILLPRAVALKFRLPCLTWEKTNVSLSLTCQLMDFSSPVHFLDESGIIRGQCGFDMPCNNITVNYASYNVTLTLATKEIENINGYWSCVQGNKTYTSHIKSFPGKESNLEIYGKVMVNNASGEASIWISCMSCRRPYTNAFEFFVNGETVDTVHYFPNSNSCGNNHGKCSKDTCACSMEGHYISLAVTNYLKQENATMSCLVSLQIGNDWVHRTSTIQFNGKDFIQMGSNDIYDEDKVVDYPKEDSGNNHKVIVGVIMVVMLLCITLPITTVNLQRRIAAKRQERQKNKFPVPKKGIDSGKRLLGETNEETENENMTELGCSDELKNSILKKVAVIKTLIHPLEEKKTLLKKFKEITTKLSPFDEKSDISKKVEDITTMIHRTEEVHNILKQIEELTTMIQQLDEHNDILKEIKGLAPMMQPLQETQNLFKEIEELKTMFQEQEVNKKEDSMTESGLVQVNAGDSNVKGMQFAVGLPKHAVNYLKLQRLMDSVVKPIVRKYIFDKEFHPKKLKDVLKTYTTIINGLSMKKSAKRKLLYDDVDSSNFDLNLMILLLRSLADMDITDRIPYEGNVSIEDDLSTINHIIISLNNNSSITEDDFERYCELLIKVARRLAGEMFDDIIRIIIQQNPSAEDVKYWHAGEGQTDEIKIYSRSEVRDGVQWKTKNKATQMARKKFEQLIAHDSLDSFYRSLSTHYQHYQHKSELLDAILVLRKEVPDIGKLDTGQIILLLQHALHSDIFLWNLETLVDVVTIEILHDQIVKSSITGMNVAIKYLENHDELIYIARMIFSGKDTQYDVLEDVAREGQFIIQGIAEKVLLRTVRGLLIKLLPSKQMNVRGGYSLPMDLKLPEMVDLMTHSSSANYFESTDIFRNLLTAIQDLLKLDRGAGFITSEYIKTIRDIGGDLPT